MIKLAIFDLDGTLLDTLGDIAGACNHALTVCGCTTHEVGEYKMFVGSGIMNLFRRALPEEQRTEEMVMKMRDAFVQYYDVHKQLVRGMDIEFSIEGEGWTYQFTIPADTYADACNAMMEEYGYDNYDVRNNAN
jgi:phosphoglycolate phosphatase-like HAD superfamily hydrolase